MTRLTLKAQGLALAERSHLLDFIQRLGQDAGRRFYTLAYHRVDEFDRHPRLDPSLISATPAQFEAQMRFIAQRYHPISAEEALEAIEHGASLPRDAVLVTVDDGYRDFQEVIFPIVRRYGIRPVLFVPTAYVGQGAFWWDQLFDALQQTRAQEIPTPLGRLSLRTPADKQAALERLRAYIKGSPFEQARRELEALCAEATSDLLSPERVTLDWDELRGLARAGVSIAAHTHTHPILSHISLDQARDEIRTSQRLIAQEIGQALPIFAFPDGKRPAFTPEVVSLLREEGFKLAWTMVEGCVNLERDDPLYLPRIALSGKMTRAQVHFRLTPAYDYRQRRAGRV
jgi:peptidoglycan/xylan/chitin deacetylase (PgdA/CDA1 family)